MAWLGRAEDDEAALVEEARRDPASFAALHGRYEPRVYAYLRARSATPEDAADLTQQVFLHVLSALPRYRERGTPFAAWLFRIARNAATDYHRRRRHTVAWDLLPEALHPAAQGDPATEAIRREELLRLRAGLAGLPVEERELLALRFAGGLTLREIGSVFGRSEAWAQRKLTKVLHTLKEDLDVG